MLYQLAPRRKSFLHLAPSLSRFRLFFTFVRFSCKIMSM
nr:MAG TPA: hypothetical protein [Caudoviricetes sp.]DAM16746.1 MAG TPA: hypothetical protein [Caudoviricetes sp.]DAO17562.1 MAG TPA: hypothetical protein [Caudoviricetes sp.]DAV53329.1 MAG TPA: hypothetical protein [Caudoviricetes sp.]